MAWLDGCWAGTVNQRNFREQWSPVRGNMMLGARLHDHQGNAAELEFLRIEPRADGVLLRRIAVGGKGGAAFQLGCIDATDEADTIFTFSNPRTTFPQEILYRRASDGWLYATIQGKLKGEERKVIFPMRRIDCETAN